MKIAAIAPSFLPHVGGAEFVVHHLACQWARQGHDVCVFNCLTTEATQAEGLYTVRKFNLLRGTDKFGGHRFPFRWWTTRSLAKSLRAYKPDFISAHFGYPTGIWLAGIDSLPNYLITCHGGDLTDNDWGYRRRWPIDRILADGLNRSTGAVAISSQARSIMQGLGVSPGKIVDIPNGVDLERFSRRVVFNLRGELGLPEDAAVILSVGRQHPAKAYDVGLHAFAQVAARSPRAYYVIIGRGMHVWDALVCKLGLSGRVVFCPGLFGDDLVGAYQQADIYFSPSKSETFSLVVLEAMAAGLAEVVTNISGSQDVIHTGVNGIVVEPGQPSQMAEALLSLLEDSTLRRRLAACNQERSRQFGWDRVSRMYLQYA